MKDPLDDEVNALLQQLPGAEPSPGSDAEDPTAPGAANRAVTAS
jgi:hypothetical protein